MTPPRRSRWEGGAGVGRVVPRAGVLGTEPRGVSGRQGGRQAPRQRRRPRRKGLRERPRHPGTQEPCCGCWTQSPSSPFPEPVRVGGAFVSAVSLLPPVASSVLPAQPGAVTQPDVSQRPTGATEQGERSPLPEPESPLCHLPRCFGLCPLEPLPRARPWAPWCLTLGSCASQPGARLTSQVNPSRGLAVQMRVAGRLLSSAFEHLLCQQGSR